VYAIIDFEDAGFGYPSYHIHQIVNWSAEDPLLIFAVIDDMGRQIEFNLIEPRLMLLRLKIILNGMICLMQTNSVKRRHWQV
jgi:hypothetical protein